MKLGPFHNVYSHFGKKMHLPTPRIEKMARKRTLTKASRALINKNSHGFLKLFISFGVPNKYEFEIRQDTNSNTQAFCVQF